MKKLFFLLIVFPLLFSCGDATGEEKSIVVVNGKNVSTITIGNLEVMTEDLGKMNYEDATKACIDLGDGWRLPTKEELNILYENKSKIGGFTDKSYLSSTESGEDGVWKQVFIDGHQGDGPKSPSSFIRVVRTVALEVKNDDNLKNEDLSNRYSESETTGGKYGRPLLLKANNKTVNGIVFYTNAIGYYYEDNYKNGVLHGLCQVWDEKDGRLLESNNFKEGKNHGICIQYWNFDIDFQKKSVKTYNEGKLVESECYDANGNRENCKELQVYEL